MGIIDDIVKNTDPLVKENIRAKMVISAEIDDEIKAHGWEVKEFHKKCNAVIPSGESNISPMKVEKWLSGIHDFKVSELILLKKVLGNGWIKRLDKKLI